MDTLLTILRAAHCRSTHHFLAIDGLRHVQTDRGRELRELALRHYDRYLTGSKDPDQRFRDFHNHVVHVEDGYWGGADESAELWRKRMLESLGQKAWGDAAYALGVLSHYFMDPFMPLHTGQTPEEAISHRPMEWSICCAYQQLYELSQSDEIQVQFTVGTEPNWLSKAVHQGARLAHRYYHPLLKEYKLEHCKMEPAAALSPVAQEMVAEIIKVVLIGWGCVVDRLAQESSVELPKDGLTMTTLVAGLKMPAAWVTRKIANQTERRAVEVLLKEYEQTGTVTQNLPDEVRQVRATRAADTGNSLREEPLPVTEKLQPVTPEPIAEKHEPVKVADSEPVSVEAKPHFDRKVATEAPEPIEMEAAEETPAESREKPEMVIHRIRAPRLNQNSPLADAPSIGPKTAERFAQIDIDTVGEFLKASPVDLNKRLRTKWITTELLQDWQAQCRLACSLGHLRAVQVQLLVGAGVKTAEQLVAADPQALASEIHRYCLTSVGKRILRGGNEPTAEDVIGWIREAKQILKAKEGAA